MAGPHYTHQIFPIGDGPTHGQILCIWENIATYKFMFTIHVSRLFESSRYTTSLLRKTLVPVFANRKTFEEDFCFYEKKRKVKIAISICFAASCFTNSTHPEQEEWHHQAPSLGIALSISPSNPIDLNCVCEHLCFISTYFVHLLTRCVLS